MSLVVVRHDLDSIFRNSYTSSVGQTAKENGRHSNVLCIIKWLSLFKNIWKGALIILYHFIIFQQDFHTFT